jgi:hypothetical protein
MPTLIVYAPFNVVAVCETTSPPPPPPPITDPPPPPPPITSKEAFATDCVKTIDAGPGMEKEYTSYVVDPEV